MTGSVEGLRLLVVEDNPADADLVLELLDEARAALPSVEVAETLAEALLVLEEEEAPDAILLDLGLPDSRGLDTLREVLDADPGAPVVVLTGQDDGELGTEALRVGAQDFLPKAGMTGAVLERSIRHSVERWRIESALLDAERRLRDSYDRLEESNHLLRTTLDSLDAAVFVVDMESRNVLDCNRAACEMFGYGISELVGENTRKLHVDDEHFEAFVGELRPVLERGETFRKTGFEMCRGDGSRFATSHVVKLLGTSAGGERPRVVSVVRDVSGRRAREERIHFQAELLEQVGQAVIATDVDGRVTYWNAAAEDLYGWSADETVGASIFDLTVFPKDRELAARIMEALEDGESFRGSFQVRRKDGSYFHALVTNAPLKDQAGDFAGVIGISTDITERVEMKRQLEETNRALRVLSSSNRAVLDSADEREILAEACRIAVQEGGYRFAWIGYAETDRARTIRPVSSAGHGDGYLDEVDFSWSDGPAGAGLAGRAIRSHRPEVSRDLGADPDFAGADAALQYGYRSVLAIPLLGEDQCLGAMMVYSSEADDFDAHEVRILSELGSDLAHGIEVHRARARQRQMTDRLQEAEKLRTVGQLAGGVAHDFNNYLTVVRTLSDLLLEREDLDGAVKRDLQEISAAAEGGALVTRQLLTFGRRDVRQPQTLDLGRTVRDTVGMLEQLIGEHVDVILDLADDVPRVYMDPGQLGQVIMNLAINARDAMPGGGRLTLSTYTESVDPASGVEDAEGERPVAVLSVSDTGVGMDVETRRHVFEPFFSTKEGGTGLGLATVYGIVREAGGEVQIESETGVGTTFRVCLPVVDGDVDESSEESASEVAIGSEVILVLEDQEAVRRVMRRVLERYGYTVVTVASVEAAVGEAEERGEDISLLLSDVRLEDGTGPEAAERIQAARPDIAVVFTSGYPAEELGTAFEGRSGPTFIQKPFEPQELAKVVRASLDANSG